MYNTIPPVSNKDTYPADTKGNSGISPDVTQTTKKTESIGVKVLTALRNFFQSIADFFDRLVNRMEVVVYEEPPAGTPEKTDTFAEPFFTTTRPATEQTTNETQAEQPTDEIPRFRPFPQFNFGHFGFVPRSQRRFNPQDDQPRFERTSNNQRSAPSSENTDTKFALGRTVDPEVLAALKDAINTNTFINGLSTNHRSSNVNTNNIYTLLGLNQNATAQEIRKAFRSLSVTLHPDKGGNAEAYKVANEAYTRLLAEHVDLAPSENQQQAAPEQPQTAPAAEEPKAPQEAPRAAAEEPVANNNAPAQPAPNVAEQPADPLDQILEEALAGMDAEAPAQQDLPPAYNGANAEPFLNQAPVEDLGQPPAYYSEADRILDEALASMDAPVEELGPPPAFEDLGPAPAFVEEPLPPAYKEVGKEEPPAYRATAQSQLNDKLAEVAREAPAAPVVVPPSA